MRYEAISIGSMRLRLELEDSGFDFSVLCEFRSRLMAGNAEYLLFETLLTCFKQRGLIKAGGRQRTDATHVLAAVRAINRVVCVGETMRAALNMLAEIAPEWLRSFAPDEWYERVSRIALKNIGFLKRKPSVQLWLK
jgi:transposase